MPFILRFARCAAVALLLAGCAPSGGGGAGRAAVASSSAGPSVSRTTAAGVFNGSPAAAGDRARLGDFCGWYADELPQSMDVLSAFLGAFEVAGGDYGDSQVDGPAQDAAQAAGEAADALNDFLANFPDDLSDPARLAVLALRDSTTALASAIRDQKGSEQINAEVALFDEAYKALRPACGG